MFQQKDPCQCLRDSVTLFVIPNFTSATMGFFQNLSANIRGVVNRDAASNPQAEEQKIAARLSRRDSLLHTTQLALEDEEALTYRHEVRAALISRAISSRNDLLVLPSSPSEDNTSCTFIFLPKTLHLTLPLRAADVEKLNRINAALPLTIRGTCAQYVRAVRLHAPSLTGPYGLAIAALRIANGHPQFSMPLVETLLTTACARGWAGLAQQRYRIPPRSARLQHREQLLRVVENLVREFFDGQRYAAVVYGSVAEPANVILADLNLMVFVDGAGAAAGGEEEEEEELIKTRAEGFAGKFRALMQGLNVRTEAVVPYEKSLVVPMCVAERLDVYDGVAKESCRVVDLEAEEYLESDEMLRRLVLAVLTTPHVCISGEAAILGGVKAEAEVTLMRRVLLLNSSLRQRVDTAVKEQREAFDAAPFADEFVEAALGDGERSDAKYLGYFDREEIREHLAGIWRRNTK